MAAALALGIHMDNKQKRKASVLSVMLDVEAQLALIDEGEFWDAEKWRPRHKDIDWRQAREHTHMNNFLMDFENDVLRDFHKKPPQGPERYKDPEWAALIKRNVYPHHSDVDWAEYVAWVSQGGGDEWFYAEDPDP